MTDTSSQHPGGASSRSSSFDSAWRFGRREFLGGVALLGASGAALAACGSPSSSKASTSTTSLPSFPLGAAAKASSKPVQITLWHSMTSANLTTLTAMTNQFNSSQSDVHVNLVNQNSYTDTLSAYTAALSGGTLPDIVQMQTTELQFMIDSESIVPIQSAVDADHYDFSDHIPSVVEFFRVKGVLYAMPFNVSSNVLYYDKKAFTAAGLDPSSPPTSLNALRAAAEKIVSSGTEKYGMSLKVTDSDFELLLALADGELVNNDNGRSARATAVSFDDAKGKAIFEWWGGMLDDKLAQPTSNTTYDNLFAIGNRIAPMTWETSAALGTILSVLNSYPQVGLGIGPFLTPSSSGGGVFIGGAGMYMVSKSPPERQDATWQYLKFLNEPVQQATWAVGTGYIPIRKSSTTLPAVAKAWNAVPGYRVPYDQILASPVDPATAGAVAGPFNQVSNDINNAITSLASGVHPDTALAQCANACNQAISSYNSRL
jgi:sn-glycerol 3-phosphate transport system substrate-binding protein